MIRISCWCSILTNQLPNLESSELPAWCSQLTCSWPWWCPWWDSNPYSLRSSSSANSSGSFDCTISYSWLSWWCEQWWWWWWWWGSSWPKLRHKHNKNINTSNLSLCVSCCPQGPIWFNIFLFLLYDMGLTNGRTLSSGWPWESF